MSALIAFFTNIANIITSVIGFVMDVFRFIATIPTILSTVFSLIGQTVSFLPPFISAALFGSLTVIGIMAVVKFLGFGGEAGE